MFDGIIAKYKVSLKLAASQRLNECEPSASFSDDRCSAYIGPFSAMLNIPQR